MKFKIYESTNSSNCKFIFWTQEDLQRIDDLGSNAETPEQRKAVVRFIEELDVKYLGSSASKNIYREAFKEFHQSAPSSTSITTPFLPSDKNLYFVLGTGYLKITYDDGAIQTVNGQYDSESWVEYQDVWQYNKNCYCELIGDARFAHITLEEGNVKSNYSIKIASLTSTDGSTKTLTNTVNNTENYSLIISPHFNFNAINYSEYDKPKGLAKSFNNQKGFTLRTNGYASAIYLEKL